MVSITRSTVFVLCLLLAASSHAVVESPFEAAFRKSLLQSFDEATGKILKLAEAFPEDKYDWRPMEKVNSVREVLVHVASTHYSLAERLGAKSPVDRKSVAGTMKTKAEALASTRLSIAFMRGVLASVPSDSLLPETKVFGAAMPTLRVAFLPVDHAHEHLGQLIAYARVNRIVPPWSQ